MAGHRDDGGRGAHQDVSGLRADDGPDRVMVSCAVDNTASARTIEHHGGVLADVRDTALGRLRRCWVDLTGTPTEAP